MALLNEEDWQGEWIGMRGPDVATGAFSALIKAISVADAVKDHLSKTFELNSVPPTEQILVVADTGYTVFLNERHILSGKPRDEQALEIAGYLIEGSNELKIENGKSSQKRHFKAGIVLPDTTISTDESWGGSISEAANLPNTWTSRVRSLPARHLRKEFRQEQAVARATLHIATGGLREAWVDGGRVSMDVLSPGFADYDKRVDSHLRRHSFNGERC